MNKVHIHLLLNHVAILGVIYSTVIFLVSYFRRNQSLITVALCGFVFAGLATIGVYLTGGAAAHALKQFPAILKSDIHAHSHAADFSIWFTSALGLLAIVGFFLDRNQRFFQKWFMLILLLLSLLTSTAIGYTGYLGGFIRHPEVRQTPNDLPVAPANDGNEEHE